VDDAHADDWSEGPLAKILFVDDDTHTRDLFGVFCRDLCVDCLLAGSAEEAIRLCREETVGVLVTDLRMPGMDGAALARFVRRHHPETEVLAFSGAGAPDDRDAGLFDEIFFKPEDYSRIIAEALKRLAIKKYPFLA
jgi:DNA-binding NtrC family response regulator